MATDLIPPSPTNIPNPQSYEQILSDALSAYAAKVGINDFNVGSAVTSFFEVVALTTARASGDIFQILKDFSVDRATGDALQRLATENGITPITAQPATGVVSIIDVSVTNIPNAGSIFTKISTAVYAGLPAPNVGSMTIAVGDASLFPASGTRRLYIGRGTANVEGPLQYNTTSNPPVQVGAYWVITLVSPTTKFHNLGESVILAQGGNRTISANATVIAPAIGANPDIQYSTTQAAVILDGESSVDNVPVVATLPGSDGNAPIGGINTITTPVSFTASVNNPSAFTTGKDNETDDQLRVRIKRALASVGLGTATAIESAVIGATAPDEAATVESVDLLEASYGAILFIDNGGIYEAKSTGVGIESIVDSALGGEQFFQLATGGTQAPVAKAFLQGSIASPFDIKGGDTLAVLVGNQTYSHIFADSDFRNPGNATSFEITASINGDTALGFEATTAGNGSFVVIRAKNEGNDSIQVEVPVFGRNAADLIGFSSGLVETLRLFKNKIPLSKDGSEATVFSAEQTLWSSLITTGETLTLSVDGTAPITYTINDSDFIATGLYTTVSSLNSLESWIEVFNAKLTGVTAEIVGQTISLTSNLGVSNRSSISIDPSSSLVTRGMFTAPTGLSAQGKTSDFTLSRNTAQFELAVPLVAGDQLSAGTTDTEARLVSDSIPSGSVTLASVGSIWILIDDFGKIINTGVVGSTLLSVSKPSTNIIRYTSNIANAFSAVLPGDYLIVWSTDLASANRIEGRVHAVTSTTLDVLVTATEFAAASAQSGVIFTDGFVVMRSDLAPQRFEVAAGTQSLDAAVAYLQAQTNSLTFGVQLEEAITVKTNSKDTSGSVMVVTADTQGSLLLLPEGVLSTSKDSLIAFYDTQQADGQLPTFVMAGFSAEAVANPPDSKISQFFSTISLANNDPDDLICFLHPYGLSNDAQPAGDHAQITSISNFLIGITNNPPITDGSLFPSTIRRLRLTDRYFIANPLQLGFQDTAVLVIDGNAVEDTFELPLYRVATTNTTLFINSSTFNAYDTASGATASFATSFPSFDFSNFKVLMQAKKTLKPTPTKTAILYRAARWGRSGEFVSVGYTYPSAQNSPIGSTIVVGESIAIMINLKSGANINTGITSTTGWNISVTPNNPVAGVDQVTYTWDATGTAPTLSLSGGEYVNITNQTQFNPKNTGVFRVSTQSGFTPTATSFSVQMPTGTGVAQSGVKTAVNGAITFYAASPTTAAAIAAYVNANLQDYVTATVVLDGDTSGSGVVVRSTYEDSNFSFSSVQLLDGLNWLASSNVGGSPQFTLKNNLALPTDVGYAFNNGEAVRLIPTTMDQVNRFISVLAVSGFTTVGTTQVVDRGTRLELSTDTLGSIGSIQILGGLANGYTIPILDSATRVDNTIMSASVDSIAGRGILSGNWFRLQAANSQNKETLFSSNTTINILSNTPSVGQSTIQLLNRELNQRYFGKPRHHIRSQGDTFRVEQQGSLACLSWNGVGTSPHFLKAALNFNDSGGGSVVAYPPTGSVDTIQYDVVAGNANFNELSIGDLVTVSGMPMSSNNGTFLVTGVSDNGTSMQVLNSAGAGQYAHGTFTFNTNTQAGDVFDVGGFIATAGTDFAVGGSANISAANLAAFYSTFASFTAVAVANVVTITVAVPNSWTYVLTYTPTASSHVTTSGATLSGNSFTAGQFSASSAVSEGDTVSILAPFNVLNQGHYRVIRRYNDAIWFENPNVIEEEVTLPLNPVSLAFDFTTSFSVVATNHTQFLTWNNTGTEPLLGNAQMGDIVTFGIDFAAANQGSFMVLRSSAKQQQITNFTMPSGAQLPPSGPGAYFLITTANNAQQYYVWFTVNGANSDPGPIGGHTALNVAVLSTDTSSQVAAKAAVVLNGATGLTATSSGNILTTTTTGFDSSSSANVTMPPPFAIDVIQTGHRTFLECVNPSAVADPTVTVTGSGSHILQCHRPQLQFSEYDASVGNSSGIGSDSFSIFGNAFGTANTGSYKILRVVDRDTAIVGGTLQQIFNVNLNGIIGSAVVSEGIPYYGYKRVKFVSGQPGAPTRSLVTFDTNAQYDKINQSAGVTMTSLNKLNFSTLIKNGIDSYRYNTGLIAEANRIIYGDPRDSTTYPGVGAAGAEIFVREPLIRKVQVSIDVRLNTGVPFARTVDQIRNSVSSLINSNPIGQSIAISAIIGAVAAIPGILAVSISFPAFSPTDDLIPLSTGEKAIILDPSSDISVSQIGS